MAMITQRGVDRFTAGTRQRFAAENEQFDRAQRLKRAARGPSFDMGEEAAARRVQMERLRQQQQDLMREQQGVREKFGDAAGTEFRSSQRLFDAEDVSILPEAVLATGMAGGRMARSEQVRTEKDRRVGDWTNADDFRAGQALGSQKMMRDAMKREAEDRKPQAVARRQAEIGNLGEALRMDKAKRKVDFDVSVAKGEVPAAMVRTGDYAFGSGGSMSRGGMNYEVPMGIGQGRTAELRRPAGQSSFPTVQPVPVTINRPASQVEPVQHGGETDMIPPPTVIDQRYKAAGNPVRTGATARSAVFEMDGAGDGVSSTAAGRDFSGVPASELFAQATGAKASPGMPDISLFDAFGEASRRFKGKAKDATKGAIWNKKPTGRGMYGGEVRKDSKGRYDTGSR